MVKLKQFTIYSGNKYDFPLQISAGKYEYLKSRKPDFDPPNIVNLLQDIFMHYGKDGFVRIWFGISVCFHVHLHLN